jgi:hypothetical protein
MKLKRIIGGVTAAVALSAAVALYAVHPVKSSDHQDTYNLANSVGHNTSADITDVYVFPSPSNSSNVVFAMDVSPLIPAGMGTSKFFDPTLMWQFKIAHGAGNYQEDQVIQFGVSGTDATQTITMYGPAKPNEVGTVNTFVPASIKFLYNKAVTGTVNGQKVSVFAGPRADPFIFDLFAFFSFLGDRNYATHTSQSDAGKGDALYNGDNAGAPGAYAPSYDKAAGRASAPTFNGFPAGTMSGSGAGAYACSTNPAQNVLADLGGGFNVLTFVVELPKSLIYGGTSGFSSSVIHVWATTNSSTTNS